MIQAERKIDSAIVQLSGIKGAEESLKEAQTVKEKVSSAWFIASLIKRVR